MTLAPVALFTYSRLDTFQQVVAQLKKNERSAETDLFIFSDGPKTAAHEAKVSLVRDFIKTITGFKSIKILESPTNKGLAKSIIDGVSQVIEEYGKVIVLEDDLVTSSNFLVYMNAALDFYAGNPDIFSVAGFSYPMKHLGEQDVYFTLRGSSWGWATWKDRWLDIDWELKTYPAFRSDRTKRRQFNKMGSDMSHMLDKQMRGETDSWAIRWVYHQFQKHSYTVFPAVSKVKNIGFESGATHTIDSAGRFRTILDNTGNGAFHFTHHIGMNPKILKQFTFHFSIYTRVKYKILNAFSRS